MRSFGLALTFLTTFPYPRGLHATQAELAASMAWFPFVGLLLGGLLAGLGWALLHILPVQPAAALLVTTLVLATGGLHLDGLADTLDGLGGGRTPEASLRIMKDSSLGAFGVLGLVLVLLLKFTLMAHLLGTGHWLALVAFPAASRWAVVVLAFLSPYARPEGGLGQAMTGGVGSRHFLVASILAALICGLALGALGLVILVAAGVFSWLASRYCLRRLGGVTGDIYGALNELQEVLALLLISAVRL